METLMEPSERIIQAVETVPALPKTVEGLLAMACERDCSSMELLSILGRDPVFSLKLLRLVNSPFCDMAEDAASLQRAAVFVGTDTLRNVAIGLGAVGAFPVRNMAGMDAAEFWLHSLATGVCARLLARRMGASEEESSEFFLAGVLHDIGKLVHALSLGDDFLQVLRMAAEPGCSISDAEGEVLGITHSETGALLAKRWGLPPLVTEAIQYHHVPSASTGSSVVTCVHASNELVKKLAFGSAGDFEVQQLSPAISERLGGTLAEMAETFGDLDQEVDKARIFIKLAEAGA